MMSSRSSAVIRGGCHLRTTKTMVPVSSASCFVSSDHCASSSFFVLLPSGTTGRPLIESTMSSTSSPASAAAPFGSIAAITGWVASSLTPICASASGPLCTSTPPIAARVGGGAEDVGGQHVVEALGQH